MTGELHSIGSVRTRGLLILLAVAVAGGMAGGAIDRLIGMSRTGRNAEEYAFSSGQSHGEPSPVGAEPGPGSRSREERRGTGREEGGEIPYFLRFVDLTPDERARILAITAKYRPAAESVMRSVAPRVAEIARRMNQETMCVLTPKQRDDWINWRKREHLSSVETDEIAKLATTNNCPK